MEFRKALLRWIILNTIGATTLVVVSLKFPSHEDPNAPAVTIAVIGVWMLCSAIFSLRLVKVRKAIAARLEKEVQKEKSGADW